MSRRVELEQRHARLAGITGIMNAMKTMAMIETHKYAQVIPHQRKLVDGILAAASDFLEFHPEFREVRGATDEGREPGLLLALGSERGFCGDFNQKVAAALLEHGGRETRWIVVGRRLANRLEGNPRLLDWLEGPNIAEDSARVLDRLIATLRRHTAGSRRWGRIDVMAHDDNGEVARHGLLPLVVPPGPKHGFPPRLHESPESLFRALIEYYLHARLPGLMQVSLMAENRQRLEHMETALNRLRTRMEDITRLGNALRQEEITEQIEVILLGMR